MKPERRKLVVFRDLGMIISSDHYVSAGDRIACSLHSISIDPETYGYRHIIVGGEFEVVGLDFRDIVLPGDVWPSRVHQSSEFDVIAREDNSSYVCFIPIDEVVFDCQRVEVSAGQTYALPINSAAVVFGKSYVIAGTAYDTVTTFVVTKDSTIEAVEDLFVVVVAPVFPEVETLPDEQPEVAP